MALCLTPEPLPRLLCLSSSPSSPPLLCKPAAVASLPAAARCPAPAWQYSVSVAASSAVAVAAAAIAIHLLLLLPLLLLPIARVLLATATATAVCRSLAKADPLMRRQILPRSQHLLFDDRAHPVLVALEPVPSAGP
ncbi:hypothetical protein B0J15DRAFT_457548 [Fusarium solani]|uniref:Uncharacterized protein n=1 Tax=Fusarium solani TaxID=169388 RepID=A0A9P9L7J9_FUSSL|nr:uncharacterized protein B0J15DRAFT_457548 [Fusarium solani]KAH7275373.1 hypothetical protein B0J15DRAFT_457548 [Fusarium solani]